MKYYQEITVVKGTGMNECHILSDVCGLIHNALTRQHKDLKGKIAISLPNYVYNSRSNKGSIGDKLRVFCDTHEQLQQLNLPVLLANLDDYIELTNTDEVGDKATHYEVYHRIMKQGVYRKAEKLYSHFINKFGEEEFAKKFGDFEGVLKHCKKHGGDYRQYPFLQMRSNSTKQNFIIRIKREVLEEPVGNLGFDSYGLSKNKNTKSAVPAW